MDMDFKIFYKKFLEIKERKWIKTKRKGYGGIGYTYECLIGKAEDTFFLPDYNGIEIKTLNEKSRSKLHLFSINPDGDYLFPMKRILNKLGYPDKKYRKYKIFNMDFNGANYTNIGFYKLAIIEIDRRNEKINLAAKDYLGNNLNLNVSWSFNLLKERINLKLKKMVIIKADNKIVNGDEYYYYKNIDYYKSKGFETFLELLETGDISVEIKIGIKKDLKHFGEMKNRGAIFSIKRENIEKLFKKVPLNYFEYQLL